MVTDKNIFRWGGIISLVTLLLSVLFHTLKSNNININGWYEFVSNLSLGLFCSGIVVVFVSMISAFSRFKISVNKMLFYSKVTKHHYDRVFYIDKSRFLLISQKIIDGFDNFYQNYTEVEFMIFNQRYKKNIQDLYIAFAAFVSPFSSAVEKNETRDLNSKDIVSFYEEAQTMTKLKFHEFVYKYYDLYATWDREMLDFVMNIDELTKERFPEKDRKHESIREIIAKR